MSGIDFEHRDHEKFHPRWTKVREICNSENVESYLLPLNEDDTTDKNVARNKIWRRRAVFAAVAGRTSQGLVGLVYQKNPSTDLPSGLDYLEKNADGAGVSIYQQSKETVKELIETGICGLWVDFPSSDGNISRADMASGKAFATITKFEPEQIWNWRTKQVGSQVKLELVVIKTTEEQVGEDGYSVEIVDCFLEMFLGSTDPEARPDEMVYQVRKWKKAEGSGKYEVVDEYLPRKGDGSTWEEIPFMFVGSQSNTWRVDQPPMYALVELNIAHYNNSAIYEDSVFTVGQVQPWMSGLQLEDALAWEKEGHYVGSGRLMGTPSGERLEFAQPEPNSLAREAMRDKMEIMVGLGALFIQPGTVAKTATQSEGEQRVDHSVLSLIASNTSDAYTQAIRWCGVFMNVAVPETMEYQVNQDFVDPNATAQDLQAVIAGFLQNAFPMEDYMIWMKRNGYFKEDKTIDELQEELGSNEPLDLEDDDEEEDPIVEE